MATNCGLVPPGRVEVSRLERYNPDGLRLQTVAISCLGPKAVSEGGVLGISSLESPLGFVLVG